VIIRDGDGDGDDESIKIDLSKIDNSVEFLYFAITIHESEGSWASFW
jgi:tellurium resistance protein TerD